VILNAKFTDLPDENAVLVPDNYREIFHNEEDWRIEVNKHFHEYL